MPILRLNVPTSTRTSSFLVENQLTVGKHVFQLVVANQNGVESDPFLITVDVRRGRIPTRPVGPGGP